MYALDDDLPIPLSGPDAPALRVGCAGGLARLGFRRGVVHRVSPHPRYLCILGYRLKDGGSRGGRLLRQAGRAGE